MEVWEGAASTGKDACCVLGTLHWTEQTQGISDCPVRDGSIVPFPFIQGLVYIALWLLLSRTTASSNPCKEQGQSGRHSLIPHTSASGKLQDPSVWPGAVLQNWGFHLGWVQAAKVKLFKRLLSPVTKAPNCVSFLRNGDRASQNTHVQPKNTHDNLIDSPCTFPGKSSQWCVFPFEMNA